MGLEQSTCCFAAIEVAGYCHQSPLPGLIHVMPAPDLRGCMYEPLAHAYECLMTSGRPV